MMLGDSTLEYLTPSVNTPLDNEFLRLPKQSGILKDLYFGCLTSSQIWLVPLAEDDRQYTYLTKFRKKTLALADGVLEGFRAYYVDR
jgi:hypothetical protein